MNYMVLFAAHKLYASLDETWKSSCADLSCTELLLPMV